jgi:hypothetical protein
VEFRGILESNPGGLWRLVAGDVGVGGGPVGEDFVEDGGAAEVGGGGGIVAEVEVFGLRAGPGGESGVEGVEV